MASKVTLSDELLYPSLYLCAFDCDNKDLILTIKSISKQELQIKGGAKKTKPVLEFSDHAKKLVLNVTNAESIAHLYGWKAEQWVGKKIAFYPTKAQFGRDVVDAIRVRETKVDDAEPPINPEWIGAILKTKTVKGLLKLGEDFSATDPTQEQVQYFGNIYDKHMAEVKDKTDVAPTVQKPPAEVPPAS